MPTILHVRLTPKASRSGIQEWVMDENGAPCLKVSVTAVPEKGKANKALIDLLAKEWRIPKSAIAIIRGETDRNKILQIDAEIPISTTP
jgi:uncharacterized protein (TIGR00251 family)